MLNKFSSVNNFMDRGSAVEGHFLLNSKIKINIILLNHDNHLSNAEQVRRHALSRRVSECLNKTCHLQRVFVINL